MKRRNRQTRLRSLFGRLLSATLCFVAFGGLAALVSHFERSSSWDDSRFVGIFHDAANRVITYNGDYMTGCEFVSKEVDSQQSQYANEVDAIAQDAADSDDQELGAEFMDTEDVEEELVAGAEIDDVFDDSSELASNDFENQWTNELKLKSYKLPTFVDVATFSLEPTDVFDDLSDDYSALFADDETDSFTPSTLLQMNGKPTYETRQFFAETKANVSEPQRPVSQTSAEQTPETNATSVNSPVYIATRPRIGGSVRRGGRPGSSVATVTVR